MMGDGGVDDGDCGRVLQEMPGYDASLSLAEGGMINSEGGVADPFADWSQGQA